MSSRTPISAVALARNFAYGLLMGASDSVPGVSGGTMAFIVGIYDSLIGSIGDGFRALVALARFDLAGLRHHLAAIDWRLVLPLGAGIATAIASLAGIVLAILDARPVEASAAFLGMVAASVAIPWRRISTHDASTFLVATIAAVAAFLFSGLPLGDTADPSAARIFLSAMIAICAMILPGVSGAFLLLVLGMYQPTLDAVDSLDFGYILTFAAGAGLGIGLFSLLLGSSLRRQHDRTMAALVGLMIGSLRALWPWQTDDRMLLEPSSAGSGLSALAVAVIGFGLVVAIERLSANRSTDALQPRH